MSDEPTSVKPTPTAIVAFLCNWCSYTASDLAGTARIKYSPYVRIIRVMCSGRVDPDLRAEGVRPGGRRRADRRLPPRRLPLHRTELQDHAPPRHAPLLPGADGHRSATGCGWSGRRRPKGNTWPSPSTSSWPTCEKLGPLNWSANWEDDGRREEAFEEIVAEHAEAMEVLA